MKRRGGKENRHMEQEKSKEKDEMGEYARR